MSNNNEFILNIIAALNKHLSKVQLKNDLKGIDNSLYVKVIAKLATSFSKKQLKKDLKELNDLYVKIGAGLKIDKNTKSKLQKRIKELQDSISEIELKTKLSKSKINDEVVSVRKAAQLRADKTPISFDLEFKKSKAIADIEYIAKKYSKLFSNASASKKYDSLLSSAYSISDESQLRSVRAQLAAFTSELRANNLASQSLGDKWRKLVERSKDLFSAATIVTTIFSQVRQSVSTFLELDTAMTNLYKVQNDITSRNQFSGLLTKWNKLAQNLAVTTESLISSMEEWSKIGFDLDMSEQLAQITTIFEKTAEISNEKANSTLISVAQAFPEIDDLGEDDYVERVEAIGNKVNKIGNEFAISSEGVSDALQNSAAALRMANNDLDESIAIVTTANKIFQSPDEVGNMAKILSARLRGQKGELEALGEDTEGMIESVSKIQTQILNLTHNKVNIFKDDNETLKSSYQIVLEIGKVYDSLSDKDQASLLEIIGGKQRMSAVASLLLNYKELEKVKKASQSADNSMQKEYNKYLESAEAHITAFKEKATEAYSAFMSGDLIKYSADIGSGLLDLVNKTDLLKHGLIAITTLKIGQRISAVGGVIASTAKQMNILGNALQQVKSLPLDDVLRESALNDIGEATKNLTEKNLKLLLSQKQLEDSDKIAILSKHNLTEEEALAKLEKMGLTDATNANTAANTANTAANTANTAANTANTAANTANAGSVTTLKGAFTGLTASVKATWAAMSTLEKASLIFAAVSTAISVGAMVFSGFNRAIEETREKAKELGDTFSSTESDIDSYKTKISELYATINDSGSSIKDVTTARQNLMTIQDELIEKFGDEKGAIDLITDAINGQSDALDILTEKQWQAAKNEFNKSGFWNNVANGIDGYSNNIDRMIDEYEGFSVTIDMSEYGGTLFTEGYDEFKQMLIDDFGATISKSSTAALELSGSASEVQQKLLDIQNILKENSTYKPDDTFTDYLGGLERSAEDVVSKYEDFYKQYVLYEKIFTNDTFTDSYQKINEAYSNYQDAFATGNEESIKEAQDNFANILTQATKGVDDQSVIDYFNNMYPALQSVVEGWKFNVAFDANTDNLQNEVQSVLDELKDENGRALTAEEILGLGEENEQYQALISIARSYNMTLEEMIELLKQRKLVSAMDYQGLVGLFGQDNVNKLSPEDLEIAYTIKNIGNMSFGELEAEIQRLKDTADKTDILSPTQILSQVQSLSTGLDQLGKIYTDVKNQEDFDWSSILNNEEFAKTFSGMGTVYDKFIKTVSNAPDDIEACQNAFNKLATSYIYNTKDANGNNIMDNLTEGTKDATVAMLEQMGVVNALEVVEAELSKQEEVHAAQRAYAARHTTELTEATLKQANAYITEAECSEIARKYLAQQYLQEKLLNGTEVSTEEDCKNLIELAKTAGYSTSVLTRLEKLKKRFEDNKIISETETTNINNAIRNIFSEAQADIQGIDFEIDFNSDAVSDAASSAAKSFTDLLDKELAVLDKKMEAGYMDFNDYIQARLGLLGDYYHQGKISADEYYSYLEKHYKQELSYRDKVINAVTRRIDKEIDGLEKQKDDIEDYYKVQIDALEKQKTLLQEANKERQRQIDLQKALYELERARNQRTKLVYSEDKGMHYVAEDSAIRDAQQEAENAEFEIKIAEIEKAISKLEEARDAETDAIDDMIDKLKEYRDQWDDITSAYEEAQEDLIAAQMLGQDWEKDILDTRLDVLNQFKDDYIAIQQAMVDAAYQAAQAMANAENVTVGDSSKTRLGNNAHGWEVVDEADPLSNSKKFSTEKEANEYARKMNKRKAEENGMTLAQFNNSDIPGYYVKKYHTGLEQGLVNKHSFDDDFKLVQEVGLGGKEVSAILNEGETVATPAQISNIADGIRSNTADDNLDDGTVVLKDGTVLRPIQPGDHAWDMMQKFQPLLEKIKGDPDYLTGNVMAEHSRQMEKIINQLNTTNIVNNRNIQQPVVNNINVTLPNVTNSTSAEALMRDLQSISRKKYQIDW